MSREERSASSPAEPDRPVSPVGGTVVYGGRQGVWVLVATVLGSGIVAIDATVVNIALPTLAADLDAGVQGLTWVVNAYNLAWAGLILLGGGLGDRFGRRRTFLLGVVWFTAASIVCAAAPNVEVLVIARALQGAGAALLTPSSLALIHASFRLRDRARAVGAWAGLGAIANAAAPLLGGWVLDVASWRWIFLFNVPVAAVVLLACRHVPETGGRSGDKARLDLAGAVLAAVGLAGISLGLSAWAGASLVDPAVWMPIVGGVLTLGAFLVWEARTTTPLLPLSLFASRLFSTTNLVTFTVYAGLTGVYFWVVIFIQVVLGYTALQAGLALLPATALVLLLSARASGWGQRTGPRLPMALGPAVCTLAAVLLARANPGSTYVADLLPAVVLLGIGLVILVGPLTAAALAAAPDEHGGVASAVNSTVARSGGLLAVAALPAVTGLGDTYTAAVSLQGAYPYAMGVCAGLMAAGAAIAATLIPGETGHKHPDSADDGWVLRFLRVFRRFGASRSTADRSP